MSRTIVTRYPGHCSDCGADLPAGSSVRYYGRGTMYGTTCHEQRPAPATSSAVATPAPQPTRNAWQPN